MVDSKSPTDNWATSEGPCESAEQLPCNESCPKCGSSSVIDEAWMISAMAQVMREHPELFDITWVPAGRHDK